MEATQKTRKEQVLDIIREAGGPVQRGELLEKIGDIGGSRLSNVLRNLKEEDKVVRINHGEYDLTERSNSRNINTQTAQRSQATIPLISASAAASTQEEWETQISSYLTMDRSIITADEGADPADMAVIRVSGNSMEGTISPGDRIVIERHTGGPIVEGVVYLWRGQQGAMMLKRAHWIDADTLELVSDNPEYTAIKVEDCDAWECVARVVRVMRAV
jgi:phage repressor protein C with HTH and peptisase S24 domain